MRTLSHAQLPDRLHFPRREIPRPEIVADIIKAIASTPLEAFATGDIITFECDEGHRHVITILGLHFGGRVDGMVYDGAAHYFSTTAKAVKNLRVLRVERMNMEEVACYRRMLSLDPQIEVAA